MQKLIYGGHALSYTTSTNLSQFTSMPLIQRKQMFQIQLKIPTGRRQTSWPLTNTTKELNQGPTRNNSSLVVGVELEPATSRFLVWHPNHSTTLPPTIILPLLSQTLLYFKPIFIFVGDSIILDSTVVDTGEQNKINRSIVWSSFT